MHHLSDWFEVSFDDEAITLRARPPGGAAWEERVPWARLVRLCWKGGEWFESDELYLFTAERPESYLVPTEAAGGAALWAEIIRRGLFGAELAIEAASTTGELYCWEPPPPPAEPLPLYAPGQLPPLDGDAITLTWDQIEWESVIRHGERLVWRERTGWEVYDRFEEIALVLQHAYGARLVDLVPTARSRYALYGDSIVASSHVASARASLGHAPTVEPFDRARLYGAIRNGDHEALRFYLAQGGDPNARDGMGESLLHRAARHRRPRMLLMLVAAGAHRAARNGAGATARDVAAEVGLAESLALLDPGRRVV